MEELCLALLYTKKQVKVSKEAHMRPHLGVTGQCTELSELLLLLIIVECCDERNHCNGGQYGSALNPAVVTLSKGQLQADAGQPADDQHHDCEVL